MARKPFAFKQFTVAQETVTLAVTTDACMFGASIELGSAATVLDLGTGTGLLLMMLAQRYPQLQGFGLELDTATAIQAAANAASSPFHERLHIAQGDWNDSEWKAINQPNNSIIGDWNDSEWKAIDQPNNSIIGDWNQSKWNALDPPINSVKADRNDPERNALDPPTNAISGITHEPQIRVNGQDNDEPHIEPGIETLSRTPWPSKFDAIVCNPPFFEGQQESQDALKRSARHQSLGSLAKLLNRAAERLNPGGTFHLLLPPESCPSDWGSWHIASQQAIAAHPGKAPHLLLLSLRLEPSTCQELETLNTYDKPGTYSQQAIELLREFYLNL
jgi:tRNA1(Val) A37 N6-methylase TrmN6